MCPCPVYESAVGVIAQAEGTGSTGRVEPKQVGQGYGCATHTEGEGRELCCSSCTPACSKKRGKKVVRIRGRCGTDVGKKGGENQSGKNLI